MAAPEGPKPAPVTPDAKAPDAKTPDQAAVTKPTEKAAANPNPTPEQLVAAKEAAHKSAKERAGGSLDSLKSDVPALTPDVSYNEPQKLMLFDKTKVLPGIDGKLPTSFTLGDHARFSGTILSRVQASLGALKDADANEKKNAPAVFLEKFLDKLRAKMLSDSQPPLYPLFVDGAPQDIRVDVTIKNGEPELVLNPQDKPKYDAAVKKIDDAALEQAKTDVAAKGAQATTEATEQQKKDTVEKVKADFQTKYPQGMSVVEALCGGDKEKVDAAFAGTGFLGLVLGLLGFGTGKGLWAMLSNNKAFAPYVKDIREKFDSMLGGVNDIDKPETFAAFYQGATPGLQKRIEKKFHTKASLTLPVDMKVKAIQFKADAEVRIADGTLKKFEAGKSYENEEFKKGATFPPETDFADVTVTVPEQAPAGATGTPGAAATGPGEKAPEKKDV